MVCQLRVRTLLVKSTRNNSIHLRYMITLNSTCKINIANRIVNRVKIHPGYKRCICHQISIWCLMNNKINKIKIQCQKVYYATKFFPEVRLFFQRSTWVHVNARCHKHFTKLWCNARTTNNNAMPELTSYPIGRVEINRKSNTQKHKFSLDAG